MDFRLLKQIILTMYLTNLQKNPEQFIKIALKILCKDLFEI